MNRIQLTFVKVKDVECQFCKEITTECPLKDAVEYLQIFYCYSCQTEYTFWSNGNPCSISLYCVIEEKTYRWSIAPSRGVHVLYYVGDPGIPGKKKNYKMRALKTFNDITCLDINPSNISDKIKTYLPYL